MVYVSITGLKLNSVFHTPRFWWHAIRSMIQARRAPGNISAKTRTVNGFHHTVSVWKDQAAMRDYLINGDHLKAMKGFRSMASGSVYGYSAERAPDWEEALRLWRAHGRAV